MPSAWKKLTANSMKQGSKAKSSSSKRTCRQQESESEQEAPVARKTKCCCYVRSRTNNSRLLGTIGSSREFRRLIPTKTCSAQVCQTEPNLANVCPRRQIMLPICQTTRNLMYLACLTS